jgi:transposase InsO family protein
LLNCRAQSKNRNVVQPITSHSVFEHIEIDLVDMSYLPQEHLGEEMKWICHIKDHFSKYSQAVSHPLCPDQECSAEKQYPIPRKTAVCVKDILLRWITAFGSPAILQSNNGLEFCNSLVNDLAKEYRFKIAHGRPYHPQAQGLVEQGNGVIKSRIAKWMDDTGRRDW